MEDWFELGAVRASPVRLVVQRRVTETAVVIGSTQSASVVVSDTLPVVRRRSGGGAVLVGPDDPLWIDLWVPRTDPLWQADVGRAAVWVGEWWAAALSALGARGLTVHTGGMVAAPWSELVCFAGVGPGEVLAGERKVVGVAQWRGREGALFHSAAYRRWAPRALAQALGLAEQPEARLALDRAAVGLVDLLDRPVGTDELADVLVGHLPPGDWERATR